MIYFEEVGRLPEGIKRIYAGINVTEMAKKAIFFFSNISNVANTPYILAQAKNIFESLLNTCKGLDKKMDDDVREKIHSVRKKIYEAKIKSMREVIVQFFAC